jgi:hypothetical protein
VLLAQARAQADYALRGWAADWLSEHFDLDRLASDLAGRFVAEVVTDPATWVAQAHQEDRATWWKRAIEDAVNRQTGELEDELEDRLRSLLEQGGPR